MASPGKPNLSNLTNLPELQQQPQPVTRSISIREATTTDGFTVLANKHDTYRIQEGTLNDAIKNGCINEHCAMMARTAKARRIAREILANQQRHPDVQDGTKKYETIDSAKSPDNANEVKSAVKAAGNERQSEDADSTERDSSEGDSSEGDSTEGDST